jgi:alcohol/geraniol dehydrogenase (NADP+)
MTTVSAYALTEPGSPLEEFQYELGDLPPTQVDIKISSCGICHSDLSMMQNDWEMTQYPLVPGHEVVGTVEAVGTAVIHLQPGDTVGVGWTSGSCMSCHQCMSGDHNLCADSQGTIVGRHGGFADRIRAESAWTVKIPTGVEALSAGPLFCGGITVFNPIVQHNVRPFDRVAVVGIGGLGHMALQFLAKWGCEVTAISTNPAKEEKARSLGAHHFLNGRDADALTSTSGNFDFILSTVNVELDWDAYVNMLGPKGHLHLVGAAPRVGSGVFPLILGQKTIGGSPIGSPATVATMLDFCARHQIAPNIRTFEMNKVNEALDVLKNESPAERLVLTR